jgi:hypothetical protein
LARQFHERYEEVAPLYGYTTRNDTRIFDPESTNGRLMRAVCLQVVGPIMAERDELLFTIVKLLQCFSDNEGTWFQYQWREYGISETMEQMILQAWDKSK